MRALLLPVFALALSSAQIAHADSLVPGSTFDVYLQETNNTYTDQGVINIRTDVNLTPGGTTPFSLGPSSGTISESYSLLSNGLDSFTFTVSTTDDLFPDYDNGPYFGGIGIGIFTPLQFTSPFDVTAAYLSYASPEGYTVAPFDYLPYHPDPFNGSYPDLDTTLGYFPISGDDTTSLVVQIEGYGVSSTPEPSSLMLLGTGLLGIAGAARRKFRKV